MPRQEQSQGICGKNVSKMPILNIPYYHMEASQNIFSVFSTKGVPSLGESFQKKFIQNLSMDSSPESDQVLEIQEFYPLCVQIWNRDGSKAAMCGNGGCALLHLAEKSGWLGKVKIESKASFFISGRKCEGFRLAEEASYELDLGPIAAKPPSHIFIEEEKIPYTFVQVGNPHAVVYVGKGENEWSLPKDFSMDTWGPKISAALKANFSLVQEKKENELKASFWELGAGKTKACGSGSIAIVKAFQGLFSKEASKSESYKIHAEGGIMCVRKCKEKLLLSSPSSVLGNKFFETEISNN